MHSNRFVLAALLALGLAGCPGTPSTPVDAGSRADATSDAGPRTPCMLDRECDDGDACTGEESCEGGFCRLGTPLDDGDACDADGDPATRDLCVDRSCSAARCGDGFVDAPSGEECDDGNSVLGDGCDDCRFTCGDDADCDDGRECNGDETCTAAHVCESSGALADGTDCASGTGRCMRGTCLARACATAADCNDGDACNGAETCVAGTGCMIADELDCDDGDACTADACLAASGCSNVLVDVDGDGHAPRSLGACGTDCDDTDADASPDATEICLNGVDDNCDGTIDEGTETTWYADCDGDGWAATGATSMTSCTPPAPGAAGCLTGGGWTARAPSAADFDCNDQNATVHSAQTVFQTTAIAGAEMSVDFDYDCDGTEEPRSGAGSCAAAGLGCRLVEGWQGDAPACGEGGTYIRGCRGGVLGCTADTETRTEACR